jgi:hypothetical protein
MPALIASMTDGVLTLTGQRCAAWFAVDVVGDSVASFGIYAGEATGEMFDAAIHLSNDAVARSSSVTFFCDALFVRRYESAFRERWARWFFEHRKQVRTMYFAIGEGPLLRMGLQMVNLAVPGLAQALDTDAQLDAALGVHAPAFLRLRLARDAWRASN